MKHKLTVPALAGLLLTSTAPLFAEQWEQVSDIKGSPLYVDPSRVISKSGVVKIWVRSVLGPMDSRWLLEFDCNKGQYRRVESIFQMGSEITTSRGDGSEPFAGIGPGYVPAYTYACRRAGLSAARPTPMSEQIVPPPFEPSSDAAAWALVYRKPAGSVYIDLKTMRRSNRRALAWLKTDVRGMTEPLLVLQEYDCERNMHRLEASERAQIQDSPWENPNELQIAALAVVCGKGEVGAKTPTVPTPSRPRPQPSPAATITAWASHPKPTMPANIRRELASPRTLFGLVEPSVYVLVSAPSVESLTTQSDVKLGSAVAISATLALTNCHVLLGNNVHSLMKGKAEHRVVNTYGDANSDRCIVEVKGPTLIPVQGVRLYSSLAVGERVYSVGSPSGLESTLAEGIISGLRTRSALNLVQTSAPISPGSSGGGLFDSAGNLVGITTFLLRDSQNLNFAIAADAYWQ